MKRLATSKAAPETISEAAPIEAASAVARAPRRRRAFTLVEILVVTAVIGVLAAIGFGVLGRGRETAQRAQCDSQLKAVAMALDAFRQENGRYPARLEDLVARKYLPQATLLKCPGDERSDGSYAESYIVRAPREADKMGEVPLLVCPHHEASHHGAQVYNARYTRQFAVSPARLSAASGTTVQRPDGKPALSGAVGMELHGGDRVNAGSGAVIEFADGSEATLSAGANVTVLQSFLEGGGRAPLYTIVRQTLGEVNYRVNHGSKFDVSTPTATAGARGTEFNVKVEGNGETTVRLLTPSPLFVSTARGTGRARQNQNVSVVGGVLGGAVDLVGGLLGGLL